MKIPKGQSEGVNRRTDNIMAKRTNKHGLQKITQKTKDRAT
jgi:ribonuclease HIII